MLSILRTLREKIPRAWAFPCLRHRYVQLCALCLISYIPLACVLAVGVHSEQRSVSDSLITRCSPRVESLWVFLQAACGLLATAANVYCVDQLTSGPAQRRAWEWPCRLRWCRPRRPTGAQRSGQPICKTPASFGMANARPPAPASSTSSTERLGEDAETTSTTPPQLTPTAPSPDEPLSPADGFSPHAGQPSPALDEHPPTYQQATAMPLRPARPTLITIPAPAPASAPASPRPPIVRRQANTHLPTQRLFHNTRRRSALRKLCLCLLFAACIVPLIASCCIQPLVRDSIYTHACSNHDWEVLLTSPPPSSRLFPSANFTHQTSTITHSFTMQLQRRNTSALFQLPPLARIAYDTSTHSYRGTFTGADAALTGGYGGMQFPELGLRGGGRDYFGFPRGVVERVDGTAVAAVGRVKRGSCAEVKVCVRGVEAAVAAVVVGTLLMETVEAAGRCRG